MIDDRTIEYGLEIDIALFPPFSDTIKHYNCRPQMIRTGSLVKKIHPYDGTARSGKPFGKTLKVIGEKENPYSVSCMNGIGKYYLLSDGDWSTEQNLRKV